MKTKFGVALLAAAALIAAGLPPVASARMGGRSGASSRSQNVMTQAQPGTGAPHMAGSGTAGTPPAGMPQMTGTHTPGTRPATMPGLGVHRGTGTQTPPATTP